MFTTPQKAYFDSYGTQIFTNESFNDGHSENRKINILFKITLRALLAWRGSLNVNINMGHENYAKCKFYVYVSTDVTADAASCWTLAAFILTLEKSEPKI